MGAQVDLVQSLLGDVLRRRGIVMLEPPAVEASLFSDITREAHEALLASWLCENDGASGPAQRNRRAPLGPITSRFLADHMAKRIGDLVRKPASFSASASCFSYYGPGDYLSRHRDRAGQCALTFLLYLDVAHSDPPDSGEYLHVVSQAGEDPLLVRSRPNRGVLMRGADIDHWRPRLGPSTRVSAVTACFSTLAGSA